jgi:ABC-type multidrug transport system fused ATPase/permease subunit
MKLILKAALKAKRHLLLLFFSLATLLIMTVANQLEMFALGVMTNTGSQLFTGSSAFRGEEQEAPKSKIANFKNLNKQSNPLNSLMIKVRQHFDLASNMRALVVVLIFIALFKASALFFSRFTTQLFAVRISKDLRQAYFEHIQSLPMSFYQKYNIGTISSRVVSDAEQIASSINSCITNYMQTPFTVVTTLFICFYISWKLSLIIFVGLPLIIIPIIFLARKVKKIARQLLTNQERFATVLIDFLAGIQTVKIFAMEAFSLKKYNEQNEAMARLQSKSAKYALLIRPILHTITTFCLAIIIIFGLYFLKMSLPQLIVFSGLLHLLYEPMKKFAEENSNVQKGIVAAERLFEVLDLKSHINDEEGALELKEFQESIEFDRVWFRYDEKWVIKDLSFKVQKGQTVAIVGPTGSGKSTIVQLIPRLYEIEKGEIRIDGKSIKTLKQRSIRENIGFVSQKPFFFLDTVFSNISYGRDYTNSEVISAAQAAHAEEFISHLPQKYGTMLAEAGQNLSGGQQQRLAIARALVKKAPILIFDEATSALDAVSEKKIKETIAKLHGKVTQILIAHRLSTIEHADKIIYLEQGEKIAEGTKEELLKTCPGFKLAWETLHRTEESPAV